MTHTIRLLAGLVLSAGAAIAAAVGLVGCPPTADNVDSATGQNAEANEPTPPTEREIDAGRKQAVQAEQRLVQTLMQRLTAALDNGPPEQALAVCSDEAQGLTAQVQSETGVSIRRTTLRLRNPQNAPDEFEQAVLEAWAAGDGAPEVREEVVVGADGEVELRRMKPLMLAGMCTTCHGDADSMSQALRDALAARYPDDEAVGYAPGQLRGAISTRVRLD